MTISHVLACGFLTGPDSWVFVATSSRGIFLSKDAAAFTVFSQNLLEEAFVLILDSIVRFDILKKWFEVAVHFPLFDYHLAIDGEHSRGHIDPP